MPHTLSRSGLFAVFVLSLVPASAVAQPQIVIDYSFDTNNFFGSVGSPQRVALETAASRLTARLTDTLTAITPGANGTWTAIFPNPATGALANVTNPTIAQNQIRVYAGGRDLTGGTLGVGGPGGFQNASGTTAFLQSLMRGQNDIFASQTTHTDFGSWGGAITFDSVGTTWNFNINNPVAGQADFLSVAEHELGHLLGFGTADSWDNLLSGSTFTGARSRQLNNGVNVGVSPDLGHFAQGTSFGGQECAMTPAITIGTRKEFNELDFAGLDDIGWQVTPIPEPTTLLGFAAVGMVGAGALRRRLRRVFV